MYWKIVFFFCFWKRGGSREGIEKGKNWSFSFVSLGRKRSSKAERLVLGLVLVKRWFFYQMKRNVHGN